MAYSLVSPILLGCQPIDETSTTQRHPLGATVLARDETYGEATFVYAKGVASTVIGSWVTFSPDDWTTALLVSGARGKVGVAMSANAAATSYGWYQVTGKAIGRALAGYVDNADVYATGTAGSIDDAAVSGDLVASARGASAVGTPSANLAEFEIDNPSIDATTGYGAGLTALTDNSGGAAADGTIGVVTAPTAITDNSGGAAADGTIGVVTIPTAITDNSGGAAADGTIGVVTLPTALTDNGGGVADGTVASQAAPTALTDNTGAGAADDTIADGLTSTAFAADNGSGAADGTIEAETNIDLLVDGTTGAADNTVSPVPTSYSNSMVAYQLGRNGAGALALANVSIGDDVLLVANITDAVDDTALYEATISVDNQIQQTGAGDHSAKMCIFVIRRSFEGVLNNNFKEFVDQAITQRATNTAIFNNVKDCAAKIATLITDAGVSNQNMADVTAKVNALVTLAGVTQNNFKELTTRQGENLTAITACRDAITEITTRIAEYRTAVTACRDAVPELVARQAEDRTAIIALTDAVKELSTKINAILTA